MAVSHAGPSPRQWSWVSLSWYIRNMEPLRVPVHIEHDEEANLFSAYVPDIPGCGEGETVAEAIEDLKESLRAYIEARGMEKAISSIRPRAEILELDLTEVARG